MFRSFVAALPILAMTLSGVGFASIANAAPSGGSGQCTYGITPPTVVPVSGVNYVMATLRPGPCTLKVTPNSSTVCLSMDGDNSSGQCATGSLNPAVVYYAYRPGATYVESGQGCVSEITPPYTICQDFPPSRYTL